MKHDSLRSNLSKVRGLGSAHDGTSHWWLQRLSAIALVPLLLWLVSAVICNVIGGDRYSVSEWLANPLTAIALLATISAMLFHSRLGLQVVIEDYVHCEALKITMLIGSTLVHALFGIAAWFAIIKLHFFVL